MALEHESYRRIHAAFVVGDMAALRREIEHLGDFPNVSPDLTIGRPLVYAVHHSPLAFVRELLEAGADPDGSDGDGFPPLIAAMTCTIPVPGAPARDDVPDLVGVLLASGADVGQRGVNDETPLHLAAEQGDLAMVELLLAHGADPNQITRIDDMETPLEMAERAGHHEVADRLRLLTTRLDWEHAARTGDLPALQRMRRSGHDVDAKDGHGMTALMRAAHAGHLESVEWLIAEGAALDHTAKSHLSALMLAIIGGHDRVAGLLADAGADLTIKGSGAPGFAGKTAVDLAEDAGKHRLAVELGRRHP
jgi:ankyrin repeat protein